jgi:hypothetical protein
LLNRKKKLTTHKRVVARAQGLTSPSVTKLAANLQARISSLDDSGTLPAEVKSADAVTLTIDSKAVACIEELLRAGLARPSCAVRA